MAQAANQLQKIQKKAQQGKSNLGGPAGGADRPLHQPTKAQLTMPAVLQQRQLQAKGARGQPQFPVRNISAYSGLT